MVSKKILLASVLLTYFITVNLTEKRMSTDLKESIEQTRQCIYMLEESNILLKKDLGKTRKKRVKKLNELKLGITKDTL